MTPLPLLDRPYAIGEQPEVVKARSDDASFWSVTTILDAMGKKAFEYWAAKSTAECAIDEQDAWRSRLEREGRASALDYLKKARYRTPEGQRSAAKLGTAVHAALEYKVLNGTYHERDRMDLELRPFLHQINKFLADFKPKFLASEVTVFNETFNYAGTCDGFMEIDGSRFIYDLKTTREPYDWEGKNKKPYPEAALQISAYRFSELAAVWRARQSSVQKRRYYLLNDTERALAVPVPEVDHGVVLHVTPESYGLHPVSCGPDIFDAFLAVVDVARFQYQMADEVIGNPMIPPSALDQVGEPFAGLPAE